MLIEAIYVMCDSFKSIWYLETRITSDVLAAVSKKKEICWVTWAMFDNIIFDNITFSTPYVVKMFDGASEAVPWRLELVTTSLF